jgi:hypothetical protein
VVIGRRAALALPFAQLRADFERALAAVHGRSRRRQTNQQADGRRPADDESAE